MPDRHLETTVSELILSFRFDVSQPYQISMALPRSYWYVYFWLQVPSQYYFIYRIIYHTKNVGSF